MSASAKNSGEDQTHGANGSTASRRLTDDEFKAECDARDYKERVALVANCSADEPMKPRKKSKAAEAKGDERKRDLENGLKQINFVTTADPGKRQTIRRAADAIAHDNSMEEIAIRAVIDDTAIRDLAIHVASSPGAIEEIQEALRSMADAERGRRTSAPNVAAAIDAVMDSKPLRKLVERLTAKTDNQFGGSVDDRVLLKLFEAIAHHSELRQGCLGLALNGKLRRLCIALGDQPKLVEAFSNTVQVARARDFFLSAWASDQDTQRNLITALSRPGILRLVASACRQRNIGPVIRIAIHHPKAPALGVSIMQLGGLSRWIVRAVLRLFVEKV